VDCDTRIPRSRRPIAVKDDQTGDEICYSVSYVVTPWGIDLSDSEKTEALADILENQFRPVTDPPFPAVIGIVDVALRYFFMTPASEAKLSKPQEVHEAISVLKVNKAHGPNGIANRALKHFPQLAVSFLAQIFNTVLLTHHFPKVWKHARMISIHKQEKDPLLSSSFRRISLLDKLVNFE
jgi:hypothetical protein